MTHRGGPPPPPAPSMEHATSGQFILHEGPADSVGDLARRPVLLWDVAASEVQLARGWMEFAIERRIPAREIRQLVGEGTGETGRAIAVLDTGERVDLIGERPTKEVHNTLNATSLATGVPFEAP